MGGPDPAGRRIAGLRSLARLPGAVLLVGYSAVSALVIGERYDVRFLEDRVAVCWVGPG